MQIREEHAGDEAGIASLVTAAFVGAPHASGQEAAIVADLRKAGQLAVSLVAQTDGVIIGHVAFSPVQVDGCDRGWYGLGPVAVSPAHRCQGVGAALIREGLTILRKTGAQGCVVLGAPDYYRRFGFAHDPALVLPGVPPEYFLRRVIAGDAPRGAVSYHAAFSER